MDGLRIAISKTLEILNGTILNFGSFSFSLFQLLFSFASLSLLLWFVRELFSD